MEILLQNVTLIMAVIGVLAFVVSVITQVFKGVGVLSKIPTDILVFVLSIVLTVVACSTNFLLSGMENTGRMEKGNSFCMCLFVYRIFAYKK